MSADNKAESKAAHPGSCACVSCEKRRAVSGQPILNPRAAIGEASERRPMTMGMEVR